MVGQPESRALSGATTRAVVVRRSTDYELLLARHATRGQADFFLRTRGQTIDDVEAEHAVIHERLRMIAGAIPARWRRTTVDRADLDRFLFEPDDVVIAVGQDGLVANLSKYLGAQPVLGVNPLPDRFDGVLARIPWDHAATLIDRIAGGHSIEIEPRTMVAASLDDGQSLVALNEIFVGHRSHQSARYRITWNDREERHSSSGLIVATGTGATGWARSICRSRRQAPKLPTPTERQLAFLVREAFPSVTTGTRLVSGHCDQRHPLALISEMNDGGVIFGDGIEDDFLRFDWGQRLTVGIADRTLNLVTT